MEIGIACHIEGCTRRGGTANSHFLRKVSGCTGAKYSSPRAVPKPYRSPRQLRRNLCLAEWQHSPTPSLFELLPRSINWPDCSQQAGLSSFQIQVRHSQPTGSPKVVEWIQ